MKLPFSSKPSPLWHWLPYFILSFVLTLFIYAAVQQNYRQSANDPQIQLAHDAAAKLASGAAPATVIPEDNVDMAKSLAPFIIVFNDHHEIQASSAKLSGQTPAPPTGVFDFAKAQGENRFTWAPQPDVREATVVVRYDHGYVLAARSLREIEIRTQRLTEMTLTVLGVLVVTGLIVASAMRK